ncbi:MAG: hypothetical protein VX346_02170 [Planctomycetota bacterium]|nr:hypothetical protein [Planctomycetota bacterium]
MGKETRWLKWLVLTLVRVVGIGLVALRYFRTDIAQRALQSALEQNVGVDRTQELPDGETIATFKMDGEIKTVTVPAGLDGRQWSFGHPSNGCQPREFYFYNLPNWLSSAPNGLLVPRNIAIKDGLKIRQ